MGFFLRENDYTEMIRRHEQIIGRKVNSRTNVRSTGSGLSSDKRVK